LSPLVKQELERCAPLLKDKAVTTRLDVKDEVWILARPELVSIAIGNLLRNACQYTEQGTVTVSLETHCIVIEDSGVGLPESVRSRLFERFVRGHDESIAGSGLGLSIVKRVVEHLGWNIQLEDSPGGGSRFTLVFQAS
jgi:signal transduction histidine kinase